MQSFPARRNVSNISGQQVPHDMIKLSHITAFLKQNDLLFGIIYVYTFFSTGQLINRLHNLWHIWQIGYISNLIQRKEAAFWRKCLRIQGTLLLNLLLLPLRITDRGQSVQDVGGHTIDTWEKTNCTWFCEKKEEHRELFPNKIGQALVIILTEG